MPVSYTHLDVYKRQKQTLDLAQSLYEKRLLTSPRTDSSFITDDMGGAVASIIALLCERLPFMAGADFTPVSYTHLDVYKRQELLLLVMETSLVSLCMKIMSVLITVILYGRMIEIYLYCCLLYTSFLSPAKGAFHCGGLRSVSGIFREISRRLPQSDEAKGSPKQSD